MDSQEFEHRTRSRPRRIWLPSAYEPRALGADGAQVRYDESPHADRRQRHTSSDGLSTGYVRVTSHHPGRPVQAPADEIPTTSRPLPGAARRLQPQGRRRSPPQRPTPTPSRPPTRRWPCRATCASSPTRSRAAGTARTPSRTSSSTTRSATASSSPGPSPAMARSIGLPSRVAVGFPRRGGPSDPRPLPRERQVRPRLARGVHLAGYGWVPYEPTPSRAPRTPGVHRRARSSRPRPADPRRHRRPPPPRPRPPVETPTPSIRDPLATSAPATSTARWAAADSMRRSATVPAEPRCGADRAGPRGRVRGAVPARLVVRGGAGGTGRRHPARASTGVDRGRRARLLAASRNEPATPASSAPSASATALPEAPSRPHLAARLEVGRYSAGRGADGRCPRAWEAAGRRGGEGQATP